MLSSVMSKGFVNWKLDDATRDVLSVSNANEKSIFLSGIDIPKDRRIKWNGMNVVDIGFEFAVYLKRALYCISLDWVNHTVTSWSNVISSSFII